MQRIEWSEKKTEGEINKIKKDIEKNKNSKNERKSC